MVHVYLFVRENISSGLIFVVEGDGRKFYLQRKFPNLRQCSVVKLTTTSKPRCQEILRTYGVVCSCISDSDSMFKLHQGRKSFCLQNFTFSSRDGPGKKYRNKAEMKERQKTILLQIGTVADKKDKNTTLHLLQGSVFLFLHHSEVIQSSCVLLTSALFQYFFAGPSLLEMQFCSNFFPGRTKLYSAACAQLLNATDGNHNG